MKSVCLFMLLISVSSTAMSADPFIEVTNPQQIKEALAVSTAIDQLSTKVRSCINAKLAAPERCMCLYQDDFDDFKRQYQIAVDRNPAWIGKTIYFKRPDNPTGYTLSFAALGMQTQMACN